MSTRPSPAGFKKASDSFYQMFWNLKNTNQTSLKGALYNLVIVIAVVISILNYHTINGQFGFNGVYYKDVATRMILSFALKRWFVRLEEEDTHLLMGISIAPFEALETLGGYFISLFINHMELILGGGFSLLTLSLFLSYAPKGFCYALWEYICYGHTLFTAALSSIDYKIVIAIIVIYLTMLALLWKSDVAFYFMIFGQTLWIIIVAYACSFLGALQVPVFVSTLVYGLIGVIYDFKSRTNIDSSNASTGNDESAPVLEQIVSFFQVQSFYGSPMSKTLLTSHAENILSDQNITGPSEVSTPKTKMHLNVVAASTINANALESPSLPSSGLNLKKSQSEIYFKALFLACIAAIVYNHVWILFITFVPIFIHLANKFIISFGIKQYVFETFTKLTAGIQNWIVERHSAILPLCLPGVLRLNKKIHRKIRKTMHESIDTASSILMIILLILTVIFASVFCAAEIYSETITIVQLGNDVLNYTVYHQPELLNIFPEGMTNSLDHMIENAYQYGRTGIEKYVDELLKDADSEQRRKLTIQLLSVWDRLIQYWVDRHKDSSFTGPQVPAFAITESIGEIVNNEELFSAAQQGLIGWVKTNIGVLLEVTDSIWLIVKTNLNILTSFIGTLLSLFLGGGQAVITFLVNSLIFLTALFYLLSSSEEKYAPLAATSYVGLSSGPLFAEAIEASISSVLIASAKLALFHGMFTWLTHTIFGARVVFLPSVFAAILAAVPFLGTYWCSIPAFFDLWLIQDRFSLGILLLLIHFLFPTSFVDPAIYADVNGGGHAYLTGLSIAGGMFWLGWEGAIFGPILLCLLVVIFNLTTNALKDSPLTPGVKSDFRTTFRFFYESVLYDEMTRKDDINQNELFTDMNL